MTRSAPSCQSTFDRAVRITFLGFAVISRSGAIRFRRSRNATALFLPISNSSNGCRTSTPGDTDDGS